MLFLLSGLVSASITWCINYLLFRLTREKAVLLSPIVEETAKTVSAVMLGASILYTHLVFGCIEAVWDLRNSRKLGLPAAWLSVGGHAVFGLASQILYLWRENILHALGAGLTIHLLWNRIIWHLINNFKAEP